VHIITSFSLCRDKFVDFGIFVAILDNGNNDEKQYHELRHQVDIVNHAMGMGAKYGNA